MKLHALKTGLGLTFLVASVAVVASPASADEPDLHPDVGAAGMTYRIATTWANANHSGLAYDWKGGLPCSGSYGDNDYKERSLSEESLTNNIESLADFNSCDTQLWDGDKFTGAHSGGTDGWFNAGESGNYQLETWANRANSIIWS